MLNTFLPVALCVALCLGIAACKGKPTAAQLNAEQEKVWREQRRQRAVKSFTDLAEKYPDSPHTAQAKESLQRLGPLPPKGKPGGAKPPTALK